MHRVREGSKRRGWVTLLTGAVIAGVMMLTPVGAHVNDEFSHLWSDHIKPKADDRYLQQDDAAKTYMKKSSQVWAVVYYTGDPFEPYLVRDRGAISVNNVESGAPGPFDDYVVVEFNRNVGKCAYNVSPNAEDLNTYEVVAGINPSDADTNTVTVQMGESDGSDMAGAGFSLLVTC